MLTTPGVQSPPLSPLLIKNRILGVYKGKEQVKIKTLFIVCVRSGFECIVERQL